MARKVKCPECGEMLEKEVAIKYKNRYYHPQCLEKKQSKSNEEPDRQRLIAYIMKLRKESKISGFILRQIKSFREEGYTYGGMLLTLHYFHEIKGNSVTADGIGIIPYVYEEAKNWYTQKVEAQKHYDQLIKQGLTELTKKRTVRVQSKPLDSKIRQKIDINSL